MPFVIPETAAKRRLSGTYFEHRQAQPGPDVDAHSVPSKRFSVPAWIPDTLRSFLAHEVENDELHLGLPLIFGLGELPARQLRIAADFGLFAGVATNELRPSPTSAACRRATSKLGASPTLAACRPGKQQARRISNVGGLPPGQTTSSSFSTS